MVDLNQNLTNQFQQQPQITAEQLIQLLAGIAGGGGGGNNVSSIGFTAPPAAPGQGAPNGDLSGILTQLLTDGGGGVISDSVSGGAPSDASPFGVTDISGFGPQLALAALPSVIGIPAQAAIRANNLAQIQNIQASLGLDPSGVFSALGSIGTGSTTDSIGDFEGTPVSLGGIISGLFGSSLSTSLTPQEVAARKFFAGLDINGPIGGTGPVNPLAGTPAAPGLATPQFETTPSVATALGLPPEGFLTPGVTGGPSTVGSGVGGGGPQVVGGGGGGATSGQPSGGGPSSGTGGGGPTSGRGRFG